MKVYTKTGDKGTTGLIGGTRVMKSDLRIEAYGTVDELNSHMGLIRDQPICNIFKDELIAIQNWLFVIGSHLANDPESSKMELPQVDGSAVVQLEQLMDKMDEKLPKMKFFVLPGGHESISFCHIARCVCRRAERATIRLSDDFEVNELIVKYLNRLSDYLFVLSRWMTMKLEVEEVPWVSK